MIVARICEKGSSAAAGSCKIEPNYNGQKDGWFPVESFNFGFMDEKGDEKKDGDARNGAPRTGGHPGAANANKTPPGKNNEQDFTELTIEKQIDTATCYLMFLAMEERKTKRGLVKSQGGKARDISADIHVLASVQIGKTAEKCIYPTIMIHLEAVNILEWGIRGSGDSRPSETIKIRYDRAAMVYCATSDGLKFMSYGPKGWDQTTNQDFDAGKFKWKWDDFKAFLPTSCVPSH